MRRDDSISTMGSFVRTAAIITPVSEPLKALRSVIVSNIQHVGSGKHDFTYFTGAIENQERKEDIIRILEGGNEALRKRMQKLNVR